MRPPAKPPKVDDHYRYWTDPPPEYLDALDMRDQPRRLAAKARANGLHDLALALKNLADHWDRRARRLRSRSC